MTRFEIGIHLTEEGRYRATLFSHDELPSGCIRVRPRVTYEVTFDSYDKAYWNMYHLLTDEVKRLLL